MAPNRCVATLALFVSSGCALVAGYQPLRDEPSVDAGADAAPSAIDASPSAIDASPFAPLQLGPGLTVWLDAGKGVALTAGKINAWSDQSGHGNDAVQPDASRQPTLHEGALAGRRTIAFDGVASGLSIADADSLRWGLDDYVIEVVAEYTNAPSNSDVDGYGALWTKGAPPYPFAGAALFANTIAPGSSSKLLAQVKTPDDSPPRGWVNSVADGLNDGRFHVFGARRAASTMLEARVDGVASTATIAAVDVSTVGQPVWIGSNGLTEQRLRGEIAEIVVYRGTLADADLARLEAYLRAKYGL